MSASISVTVNGEARRTSATTVAALVRELELDPAKVAVERNGAIAPRSTLETVALGEGDVLEIVHFVGGGDGRRTLSLRPFGAPSSPARGEGK